MPSQTHAQAVSALRPPHPMTALAPTARTGKCIKCEAETHYVCSACDLFAFYCMPEHIVEVRIEFAALGK